MKDSFTQSPKEDAKTPGNFAIDSFFAPLRETVLH
jgi:hypothetical protein